MKKIGRYTILDKLGKGGMGAVYKAAMPVTGKVVALKLLDPAEVLEDILGRESIKSIFRSEAVTMAALRHPYIADVWDYDEDEQGRPFFIMEYYCNNLGTMIGEHYRVEKKSRIIAPDKALHYGGQILTGLACLHHAGIIHRDIKPFNIMVTDQDTVKICDFGMSKVRGESFASPENLKIGSPFYAAPEQMLAPEQTDARADLYAAAVLLYRMLTGELPSMKNFSLSLVHAYYDQTWDAFFAKGLSLQKEERFQSAGEMLDGLHRLHLHWENSKENACRLTSPANNARRPKLERRLRQHAEKVGLQKALSLFEVSPLFQPLHYLENQWQAAADGTVADHATGLLWQSAGSDYPMNWHEAEKFVVALNLQGFAGRSDWRLPTVNELLSLLQEVSRMEKYCASPLFDPEKKWLWSGDWRSGTTAWYVSMDMGFAGWQDTNCAYFVRAVSSTDRFVSAP